MSRLKLFWCTEMKLDSVFPKAYKKIKAEDRKHTKCTEYFLYCRTCIIITNVTVENRLETFRVSYCMAIKNWHIVLISYHMVDECGFIGNERAFYPYDLFIVTTVIFGRLAGSSDTILHVNTLIMKLVQWCLMRLSVDWALGTVASSQMKTTRKNIVETEALLNLQNLGLFHIYVIKDLYSRTHLWYYVNNTELFIYN